MPRFPSGSHLSSKSNAPLSWVGGQRYGVENCGLATRFVTPTPVSTLMLLKVLTGVGVTKRTVLTLLKVYLPTVLLRRRRRRRHRVLLYIYCRSEP